MKRLFAVTPLSLAAVVAISPIATAQQSTFVRAKVESISASTTPKRDRTRPYTFTTRGRIVPPAACAAGVAPVAGGNCVGLPVVCPPGTTDATYCLRPPICPVGTTSTGQCVALPQSAICSGKVTVRFKKRFTTISARTVSLRSDCTYRSRVSFRVRSRIRSGTLRRLVRFQGNPFLLPINSSVRTVRAG